MAVEVCSVKLSQGFSNGTLSHFFPPRFCLEVECKKGGGSVFLEARCTGTRKETVHATINLVNPMDKHTASLLVKQIKS